MKKFRNRFKKILICVCTVAMIFVSSIVSVLADEEAIIELVDDNLYCGYCAGVELPYLPDDVYGKNYVIVCREFNGAFQNRFVELYLLPDDLTVYAKYSGGSNLSQTYQHTGNYGVIIFTFSTDTLLTYYRYADGVWTAPAVLSGAVVVETPNVYIHKSTVDILNTDDNSVVFYTKNADVIKNPVSAVFLQNFGDMLSGFFNETEKNPISLFCFACVAGVGLVGILGKMLFLRY